MKLYLLGLALVLSASLFIARQDKRGSENCERDSSCRDQFTASAESKEQKSKSYIYDPDRYGPSWYRLFRWPTSVEVWALMLTLIAVADQAQQTAISAQVASKTLMLQFRPKLIVRSIKMTMIGNDTFVIATHIANLGGTYAKVISHQIEVKWVRKSHWSGQTEDFIDRSSLPVSDIPPGSQIAIDVPCAETSYALSFARGNSSEQQFQTLNLVCEGLIEYEDGNGVVRRTKFKRIHDFRQMRFIPDQNSEEEYAD